LEVIDFKVRILINPLYFVWITKGMV